MYRFFPLCTEILREKIRTQAKIRTIFRKSFFFQVWFREGGRSQVPRQQGHEEPREVHPGAAGQRGARGAGQGQKYFCAS